MKSLVQEAAGIHKAIEQAWQKAGKPSEFQVKILEEPERNFFGMVTRSAKVAVFFEASQTQAPEQKKQHKAKGDEKSQKGAPDKQRGHQKQEKQQKGQQGREQHSQKQQTKQQDKQHTFKQTSEQATHKQEKKQQEPKQAQHKQPEREHSSARKKQPQQASKEQTKTQETAQSAQQQKQKSQQSQQQETQQQQTPEQQRSKKKPQSLWTQERVQHATNWLRDVLDKMGYTDVSFTAEPQNLYLRIELSDHLLTRKDREKQLLASLASLMMATMQRHYKKAFRGHKVVITHP